MANLKKLNSDIRRAKKTKAKPKPKPAATAPEPLVNFDPLVQAIDRLQQPIVNVEQREPVSYNVTVDLNSRGDMVGARIEPVK
jgi:hypothetical protein